MAYMLVLFLYPFNQSMSLVASFNYFSFQVIINTYFIIPIVLISLDLFHLVIGGGSLVCCSPWGRKESDTTK